MNPRVRLGVFLLAVSLALVGAGVNAHEIPAVAQRATLSSEVVAVPTAGVPGMRAWKIFSQPRVFRSESENAVTKGRRQRSSAFQVSRFSAAPGSSAAWMRRSGASSVPVSVTRESKAVRHMSSSTNLAMGRSLVTARVVVGRDAVTVTSGIDGLVLLKATNSGFEGYRRDRFTTLTETRDRIFATELSAEWTFADGGSDPHVDPATTRDAVRAAIVHAFGATYSPSVQRTLYEMSEAVDRHAKLEGLLEILARADEKAIVFTQFKSTMEFLARELRACGHSTVTFHGGMTTSEKDDAIEMLKIDPALAAALAAASSPSLWTSRARPAGARPTGVG